MSESGEAPPAPATAPDDDPLENSELAGHLLATQQAAAERRTARQRGAKLHRFGLAGAAAALGYFTYASNVADPFHLYLGQAIFVLAILPALMWAKRAQFGLPLFEAFMMTGVNAYAIPLMSGRQTLKAYNVDTITTAALAVVLYQVVANLTYFGTRTRPKRTRLWRREIVSHDISRVLGYGMIVTTAYTVAIQFFDIIPNDIAPELRAICYGIGIIATFVQCHRWGRGDLPRYEKTIFVVQLFLQVIFSWVSLFLVQGVSILMLSLLGYIAGSKRVPILVIAAILPVIALLFNGKSAMRAKYWDAKAPAPTITEVPAFFSEWITNGLAVQQQDKPDDSTNVLQRTSLIHMMCLVVSKSPEPQPYLMGETYGQIPGQFVPRFFWPGKPLGHVSTYTLCVYYGLQTQEETLGTTIGFGQLAEAYANFGFAGMALLGCMMGLFFKKVSAWGAESPIFSYPGLFMVVLMAWTFQTELPLSAWLSSFYQACAAVLGIPFILKNFFK